MGRAGLDLSQTQTSGYLPLGNGLQEGDKETVGGCFLFGTCMAFILSVGEYSHSMHGRVAH